LAGRIYSESVILNVPGVYTAVRPLFGQAGGGAASDTDHADQHRHSSFRKRGSAAVTALFESLDRRQQLETQLQLLRRPHAREEERGFGFGEGFTSGFTSGGSGGGAGTEFNSRRLRWTPKPRAPRWTITCGRSKES